MCLRLQFFLVRSAFLRFYFMIIYKDTNIVFKKMMKQKIIYIYKINNWINWKKNENSDKSCLICDDVI